MGGRGRRNTEGRWAAGERERDLVGGGCVRGYVEGGFWGFAQGGGMREGEGGAVIWRVHRDHRGGGQSGARGGKARPWKAGEAIAEAWPPTRTP